MIILTPQSGGQFSGRLQRRAQGRVARTLERPIDAVAGQEASGHLSKILIQDRYSPLGDRYGAYHLDPRDGVKGGDDSSTNLSGRGGQTKDRGGWVPQVWFSKPGFPIPQHPNDLIFHFDLELFYPLQASATPFSSVAY